MHQIPKKGILELKKGKRTAGYPCPNIFFELLRTNKFFLFFERDFFLNVRRTKCSDKGLQMASKAVLDIKPPQAPQAQYIFTRVE